LEREVLHVPIADLGRILGSAGRLEREVDKHIVERAKRKEVVYQNLNMADLGKAGMVVAGLGMVDQGMAKVFE
jgi:hypothetical protein